MFHHIINEMGRNLTLVYTNWFMVKLILMLVILLKVIEPSDDVLCKDLLYFMRLNETGDVHFLVLNNFFIMEGVFYEWKAKFELPVY